MNAKLLLLAAPAALAAVALASAQDLGTSPVSAGERVDLRALPTPQVLPEIPAIEPRRKLPPPEQVPNMPEEPPVVNEGEYSSYCTSTVNSSGFNAWLDLTGDMSCCSNNTSLVAYGVPAQTLGIFFFGTNPAQIPMGNGYLCVSPFHPGFYRLPSVSTTSWYMASAYVDLHALPAPVAITPGATRYFQFWFRDFAGGAAQSNFSNGLKVCFCN